MTASPVLLINPRIGLRRNARIPLSLLHLAAVLEGKRRWRILDGNFEADLVAKAVAAVRSEPHALVGVTVMPGPQVATAIEVSKAIREAAPEVPIVWGGYFPTLYPAAALNASYVDVLVRGQGEQPLLDLLELLDRASLDASALDGLGPASRMRRVVLPLSARALLAAWAIAFALGLSELPATNLATPPGVPPMSVVIWSLLHTGVESHLAGVALIMLLVVAAAGLLAATALWSLGSIKAMNGANRS